MTSVLSKGARSDVYQTVTAKIVVAIEAGAGSYVLPWYRSGVPLDRPKNALTGAYYRGVNVVALWAAATVTNFTSGFWATYRQWQALGAQVRRGEISTTIVFFRRLDEDPEQEETERPRLVARASRVFNADQVDGWTAAPSAPSAPLERLNEVDAFVRATKATIRHGGELAFYQLREDAISIPAPERFVGSPTRTAREAYYSVLLHELTHWTGAEHRLARTFGARFGDKAYAMEELVADLGAAFLCADLGIVNEPRPDHAAYLASWLSVLKDDPKAIFTAARMAAAAADFLHLFRGTI